jgi:tripartite ATP-independent transporter DctM subunit
MSELQIGLALVGAMVALVVAGMWIGVTLLALSFLGVWLVRDNWAVAERLLAMAAFSGVQDYLFATIPLFVLMGMFVKVADIGKDTFAVAHWMLHRIAGGLGMATVIANALFAAVTGISIASAAIFTKVAVPEMLRSGYSARLAVGTVAGSSILGMLIPPSLLLIIYGVLSEQSIGKLFIAAVIPGLLMAVAFCAGVYLVAKLFPGFAFARGREWHGGDSGITGIGDALARLVPIVVLVALVLGGLYGGLFTPTEAGAVGAFGAFTIALVRRRLTLPKLWQVLQETGLVSVSLLFLLIAANMYSRMLTMAGIPEAVASALDGLGMIGFLILYIVFLILLGMVIDSTSILLIVVPISVPIATALGIDLIHFGLITVIAVEIGLLTPPLGLSAYAVKASLDDDRVRLGDVFIGAFPFVLVMLSVLAAIIAFPGLVTALID